jgi:hypothetical protein
LPVSFDDLFLGPGIGETFDEELDRQSRSRDDGRAYHHVRVCGNQLFPSVVWRLSCANDNRRKCPTLLPTGHHRGDGAVDLFMRD